MDSFLEAEKVEEFHNFIMQQPPAVHAFMTTVRSNGTPYLRQVSTFVEGWDIQTITNPGKLKMKHLLNNPNVAVMWVQHRPDSVAKNVWVSGKAELVTDAGKIQEFLERRSKASGRPIPQATYERVLVIVRPEFLRAEGFAEGQTPQFLRQFN